MIRFFAAHPTAANILMLLFIVIGLVSLPQIHRETLPKINQYQLDIMVPYPGASAENVEQKICLSLENALDGISFLEEKYCVARQNVGQMTVAGGRWHWTIATRPAGSDGPLNIWWSSMGQKVE